jgi:hypothetical protein
MKNNENLNEKNTISFKDENNNNNNITSDFLITEFSQDKNINNLMFNSGSNFIQNFDYNNKTYDELNTYINFLQKEIDKTEEKNNSLKKKCEEIKNKGQEIIEINEEYSKNCKKEENEYLMLVEENKKLKDNYQKILIDYQKGKFNTEKAVNYLIENEKNKQLIKENNILKEQLISLEKILFNMKMTLDILYNNTDEYRKKMFEELLDILNGKDFELQKKEKIIKNLIEIKEALIAEKNKLKI